MAKFNYKKWVTKNKYGSLNEQGITGSLFTGSATGSGCVIDGVQGMQLRSVDMCCENPAFSNYYLDTPIEGCRWGSNALYINTGVLPSSPAELYNYCAVVEDEVNGGYRTPNQSDVGRLIYRNGFQTNKNSVITQVLPINPNTVGAHSPSKYNFLDGCVTNDNYPDGPLGSGDPDPIDPDPVEEFGPCYGCVDNQITPNAGFTNSNNAGVCGTVNGVTFYDDENHPQLEGCGAEGSFGTGGNYTVFDYPPAFDVVQWTANFIAMIIEHPNPCNFLTQRITLFMNQLQSGVGPLQANQLMQKIAVCQELFQMTGCSGINEQNRLSGIRRYRLDPKAANVLKKAARRLRGLAQRKRGRNRVRRENKQLSTIKRIIKETLSELQEKQKACSCRGNVCKTAGGDLCPSSECEGKCKGVEDTVTKKR